MIPKPPLPPPTASKPSNPHLTDSSSALAAKPSASGAAAPTTTGRRSGLIRYMHKVVRDSRRQCQSVKADTKHPLPSTVPTPADGAGGRPMG